MIELSTPYPWLDMNVVERNIRNMTQLLARAGVSHRPHIKTHKSVELAKLQLELGAKGITCAKLSEAAVMADAGIRDILVAYPLVGRDKMRRLGELMSVANVKVTSDNMVNAVQLSELGERLGRDIEVLIEIGAQNRRGGLPVTAELPAFAEKLRHLPRLRIKGIITYVGLRPGLSEPGQLEQLAIEEAYLMEESKRTLANAGFPVEVVSAGSSATSLFASRHGCITESRAGSYIFNDMNAVYLGAADLKDCALKIRTTVVSIPEAGLATIDAGSKTLSSDTKPGQGYGYVVSCPKLELYKLNEEHGYLKYPAQHVKLEIGQELDIIPNHACVIGNLHDYYFAFRDGTFRRMIRVDARGKSY